MGLWTIYPPETAFYKRFPEVINDSPRIGQLCWVPVIYKDDIWYFSDMARIQAHDHENLSAKLSRPHARMFRSSPRLPITGLKIGLHEEFLGIRAKKRPAIVVGPGPISTKGIVKTGEDRLRAKPRCFVVPLYSVATQEKVTTILPKMLADARELKESLFFPCPRLPDAMIEDSLARLDRLCICFQYNGWIAWEKWGLQDEPLGILMAMVRECFISSGEDELRKLREAIAGPG